MLQNMLTAEESKETEQDDDFVSTIKTKKVSTKKSNFKNKFLQMSEMHLHKEDREIDKQLSVSPPTPRNRSNALIKVTCRVCGKVEEISGSLVMDQSRYKCNKCCSGAG